VLQRPPSVPDSVLGAVPAWKKASPKTYSFQRNVFTCLRVCFVLFCWLVWRGSWGPQGQWDLLSTNETWSCFSQACTGCWVCLARCAGKNRLFGLFYHFLNARRTSQAPASRGWLTPPLSDPALGMCCFSSDRRRRGDEYELLDHLSEAEWIPPVTQMGKLPMSSNTLSHVALGWGPAARICNQRGAGRLKDKPSVLQPCTSWKQVDKFVRVILGDGDIWELSSQIQGRGCAGAEVATEKVKWSCTWSCFSLMVQAGAAWMSKLNFCLYACMNQGNSGVPAWIGHTWGSSKPPDLPGVEITLDGFVFPDKPSKWLYWLTPKVYAAQPPAFQQWVPS